MGYAALVLACTALAAALYTPVPLALPLGIVALAFILADLRTALLACAACTVVSTELQLGSLGLDFPSEPLMIVLAALTVVYVLRHGRRIEAAVVVHPVSLALVLHVAWIGFTALTAADSTVALKFLAAKMWYVLPFYVLAALLLRGERSLLRLTRFIAVPMAITLGYCVARHASMGFAFDAVNQAMYPFFRNHVTYASLSTTLLPLFVYGGLREARGGFWRKLMWAVAALSLVAIYTSYTRAAFVSLVLGAGFLLVMRFRLTRLSLAVGAVAIVAVSSLLVSQNRFFGFAPDYNKTITHTEFSDLLEATYQLTDISLMERVYRWVAGAYMSAERPLLGWGPGNFYGSYRGYALESFKTYVSDNPEKSGIHNYLLMVLVEQGYPGLVIFFALCALGLLTAERAYRRAATREHRWAAGALAASLAINLSFQLINDMLESDKSGPWFFLCLALLVVLDLEGRLATRWRERTNLEPSRGASAIPDGAAPAR